MSKLVSVMKMFSFGNMLAIMRCRIFCIPVCYPKI